ncbi:endothelin-converting enzyme 1-like [Uranotaenia lowii]|uniref:endothelin-converting enzyme 1-like n=1 Tax=Uranotaenia lowii TaxID=190385 RepID=UPI00247A8117|nr:endothelin-converting enzyme 1-like [Uranotaenia lowii]
MKQCESHHPRLKTKGVHRRDSRCHIICRRTIMGILLVTVVKRYLIHGLPPADTLAPDLCDTKECLRSAAAFKHNMDPTVDPCDDFYRYACGKWAEENPRPHQEFYHTWFQERQQKIYGIIRERLISNITADDPVPVIKAKAMYMGCLNLKNQEQENLRAAEKSLRQWGLPFLPRLLRGTSNSTGYKFDWVSSIAKIKRTLGLNVIIGFNIVEDQMIKRLTLGYPYEAKNSIFPSYESSKKQSSARLNQLESEPEQSNENERNAPEEVEEELPRIREILEILDPNGKVSWNDETIMRLSKAYFNFEKILNEAPTEDDYGEERSTEDDYGWDYTIEELQERTDSNLTTSFPIWQRYINTLFKNLPTARPSAEDKFQIESRNLVYLRNIVPKVLEQSPEVIELYVWVQVTRFLIYHEFNNYKHLDENGCANHVLHLMGLAVSYAIAEPDFLTETKPRLHQMLENIGASFREMVLETDWMDAETKFASLEKSRAMQAIIGVPEWILDSEKLTDHYKTLNIDSERHVQNWVNAIEFLNIKWLASWREEVNKIWNQDPTEVNAYYFFDRNAINIPMAMIQYPFYYLGLEALNYGAIGLTLGHEVTHGFDNSGIEYDKTGNHGQWWSNDTLKEYKKRAQCLVEQYNGFYLQEAKQFIDGTLTLGENIADNAGLREAFRAYRRFLKENGPEPLLTGMEDFSHEQLFFLSFANQECGTVWTIGAEQLLEDEHSPSEFRVTGVLRNMEEFSEAFQCPKGSAMNPEHKCLLW